MNRHSIHLVNGWPIVYTVTAFTLGLVAVVSVAAGGGHEGLMSAIRWTPRPAVVCFLLAYTASATHQLLPHSPFTKWQRRNRRYLGVAFGSAHIIHGMGLATLAALDPAGFYADQGLVTLIGGGSCYAFIVVMVATSFDRTTRLVGPKAWRFIHGFGALFIWVIFTRSYFFRMITPEVNTPWFTLAALMCFAAMGLKIVALVQRLVRRRTPVTTAQTA